MNEIAGFEMIEHYSGNGIDDGHPESQIAKIAMEGIVPSTECFDLHVYFNSTNLAASME